MDLIEHSGEAAERHPWERARAAFFVRLISDWGVSSTARVLDVGAGDAWLASRLLPHFDPSAQIMCWDKNYEDVDLAESTGGDRVHLTRDRPTRRFGGLLMLDVIEHVPDDVQFVAETVNDLLVEGGWAVISVPAYQWLFTDHDRALQHFRRYSPAQCREVLGAAGLSIEREGGLFSSLLLLRIAQMLGKRLSRSSTGGAHGIGRWNGGARLTNALTVLLEGEACLDWYLSSIPLHIPGLSYWACCRRRG